jgi:nicotinamidase-related amidase
VLRIGQWDVPETLEEIVDPSITALLIIDMQNDFAAQGGALQASGGNVDAIQSIVSPIGTLASACRARDISVMHARLLTLPNGQSDSVGSLRFKVRVNKNYGRDVRTPLAYTVKDTWGAEFVDELQPLPGEPVVEKFRSSAFYETSLDVILRAKRIISVLVAGCTTEGCVEATVRDLAARDYIPVVVRDCVASDHRHLHDASLTVMGGYGAELTTSGEILPILEGGSRVATRTKGHHG